MIGRRAMSVGGGVAAILFCVSLGYSQDNYNNWTSNSIILLNTTSSGANVISTQYNFPVLIRLTTANASALLNGGANSNLSDIRFANHYGTHLPYQLSQVDSSMPGNKRAYIWVNVDTLWGNLSGTPGGENSITMYWGNRSAVDSTNAPAVFPAANNFLGVYHMNTRTGTGPYTYADATGNNPMSGSAGLTDTAGPFDSAASFHMSGTSTSVNCSDSMFIKSLLGSPTVVTLSCWVRVDSLDQAGGNGGIGTRFMDLGNNIGMQDNGVGSVASCSIDSLVAAYHTSASGSWENYGWPNAAQGTGHACWGSATSTPVGYAHTWRYIALSYSPGVGQDSIEWYFNGTLQYSLNTTAPITYYSGGVNTVIGHAAVDAGEGMQGAMCEARLESVVRSGDWIHLCYENQQPNDSLTSVTIMSLSGVPLLLLPANGATGQPVSESFSWSAAAGATSYGLQVSLNTAFSTTLFSQSGITALSQTVSGLAVNATYYWHVNAAGSSSNAWAGTWSFTTSPVPGTPVLSSPANGATGEPLSLSLSWGSANGATSYALLVSTVSTFATTVLSQSGLTNTSVAISGLATKTTYFWQVESINNVAHLWASAWSFSTVTTGVLANSEGAVLKTDFGVRGNALLYSVASPGAVEITFSDLLGRVALVVNKNMAAGNYTLGLRNLSLAPGSYIVRFKAGGVERIKTVMLER